MVCVTFKIVVLEYKFKNVPLFNKPPFLGMDIVQNQIRLGNVQLDKMYSFYLIECAVWCQVKNKPFLSDVKL